MRGVLVRAKPVVDMGRKNVSEAVGVLEALMVAISAVPESDYGDEPRFLVGDHDHASGISGDFGKGFADFRGQRGLELAGLSGRGHELYALRGNVVRVRGPLHDRGSG